MKKRLFIQTIVLVFLGSVVRFFYGVYYHPWTSGPDHIAMEIITANGEWSYAHLIHYPHEGGTIITSILGRFVSLFTSLNSLVIVAFILDLVSRFFQLIIVRKVTNQNIFWTYGIWTIFAVPMMLPWATVNFGLHAISDIFPFLMLYFLSVKRYDRKYMILMGVFVGMAVWFSYVNVVLLIPFFMLPLIKKGMWNNWKLGFASFAGVMFLHFLVRMNFDYGFELTKLNLSTIRGTNFEWLNPETYHRVYKVWTNALAESAVGIQNSPYVFFELKYLWLLFVGAGVYGFFKRKISIENALCYKHAALMIVAFVLLYAISPFYYDNHEFGHAFAYRHFAYIMPLIALITFWGMSFLPYKKIFTGVFLGLSIYLGIIAFTVEPSNNNANVAAGYVLTEKFGAHPNELKEIIRSTTYEQSDLLKGVAWRITAVLFEQVSRSDVILVNERAAELLQWKYDFFKEQESVFYEGVEIAFGSDITPVLDSTLLPIVKELIR